MFSSGFYITAELKIKDKDKILETREALQTLCRTTLQEESGCTLFQLHQCQEDMNVYYYGNVLIQKKLITLILDRPILKNILQEI